MMVLYVGDGTVIFKVSQLQEDLEK